MDDLAAEAWAAMVLAEAATAYAYAAAGPLLGDDQRAVAAQWYDEHERARDEALLALTDTGAEPIGIPPFFAVPQPLQTPAQARGLLAEVEARLALAYADLIAAVPAEQRQRGIDGLLLANTRARDWGATTGAWGATTPDTEA